MMIISWHEPTGRWYWFAVMKNGSSASGYSPDYHETVQFAQDFLRS